MEVGHFGSEQEIKRPFLLSSPLLLLSSTAVLLRQTSRSSGNICEGLCFFFHLPVAANVAACVYKAEKRTWPKRMDRSVVHGHSFHHCLEARWSAVMRCCSWSICWTRSLLPTFWIHNDIIDVSQEHYSASSSFTVRYYLNIIQMSSEEYNENHFALPIIDFKHQTSGKHLLVV